MKTIDLMQIKPATEIMCAGKLCKYVCTEIENDDGIWNDDYPVSKGYWVIHEGFMHHVYKEVAQ